MPEMLQDRDKIISEIIRRQRVGRDILCRYEHSVLPRHARRKGCAHKSNKLFEVITGITGIIRHRDLLQSVISDAIRIGGTITRTCEENPSMRFLGIG